MPRIRWCNCKYCRKRNDRPNYWDHEHTSRTLRGDKAYHNHVLRTKAHAHMSLHKQNPHARKYEPFPLCHRSTTLRIPRYKRGKGHRGTLQDMYGHMLAVRHKLAHMTTARSRYTSSSRGAPCRSGTALEGPRPRKEGTALGGKVDDTYAGIRDPARKLRRNCVPANVGSALASQTSHRSRRTEASGLRGGNGSLDMPMRKQHLGQQRLLLRH